jgi:type VI protein secretion system component VasF
MANHDDKIKEAQEAWIKSTTDLMQTILATGMVDIVDQEKLVDKVINEVKDDMETIAQEAATDAVSNADINTEAYIS